MKNILKLEVNEKRNFPHAERSKSLLSVPSIFVDNLDSTSSVSSTSMSDDKRSDFETVSMIVRNVEAADKAIEKATADEVAKGNTKAKHDFINDLKGTIQEKFHISKKKDAMHEAGKKKEILHELKENMSGKFHQIAEKIHHIHLPHIHHAHAHDDESLIAQAMQTILLEKFNIVEASSGIHPSTSDAGKKRDVTLKFFLKKCLTFFFLLLLHLNAHYFYVQLGKRKQSSTSLQSIKQKFNLFQRPRRSVDLPTETTSLKSISEINSSSNVETTMTKSSSSSSSSSSSLSTSSSEGDSSIVDLKIHEETLSEASFDSTVTVLEKSRDLKDLKLSVQNFDSFLSSNNLNLGASFADTNKKPLHESLLSLSRNELLSASPNVKTHARTESIGCKLTASTGSPSKQQQGHQQSGSLTGKDGLSNICRRSSDSDLSITPKGECVNCS